LKIAKVVDKERRSWHKYERRIDRKGGKNYEMKTKRSSRKL
jgi:hypothetical protein